MNERNPGRARQQIEPGLQEHTFPSNRHQEFNNISDRQRWLSSIGGLAVVWHGLRQNGVSRWPLTLIGAGLLYQGLAGGNLLRSIPMLEKIPLAREMIAGPPQLRIRQSLTIARPAADLYNYWRKLENLPTFMPHIKSVQELDEQRSHWVVQIVRDVELEWDAQITVDRENEMIAWETLPEADIQNRGYVKFIPTERGTEVSVSIEYSPPGAAVGRFAGRAIKFIAAQQIKEEIRNFKRLMETDELPTTDGQPAAREEAWQQSNRRAGHNNGHANIYRQNLGSESISESSRDAQQAKNVQTDRRQQTDSDKQRHSVSTDTAHSDASGMRASESGSSGSAQSGSGQSGTEASGGET